ncbi:MAG: cation:proton antiporter [Cytophagales bacterium]|nr:cation:proton antiporter [Cytophagales bacterium]
MITHNIYYDIILICGVIIISYSLGHISKLTKIPSVLLLIIFGVLLQFVMQEFNIALTSRIFQILQLLGIIGLIMIVLEAALDLKLTAEKRPLILRAFCVAFIALVGSSLILAYLISYFLGYTFYISLIYAIPLSIMSSAIIIPSISRLQPAKKEFMIYESTFSDILGIMLFYFTIGTNENATTLSIVREVGFNIAITVALSVILSYLLVLIFQKVQQSAHLFLLISVLISLYAVGKIFHLSSLIVILVFGLMLGNYALFFSGRLKKLVDVDILNKINKDFHLVTLESAFVVRTFFFVVFGMTLDLGSLLNIQTAFISVSLIAALYVVRVMSLRFFVKQLNPKWFIAPRGLITVLLFFAIPEVYVQETFSSGILLYAILLTGVVMTLGMILYKNEAEDVPELLFDSLQSLDQELIRRE